jgi:hypothetical protein
MTENLNDLYTFVYRGQLTEEALDGADRRAKQDNQSEYENYWSLLSVDELDEQHVQSANTMAAVYVAVAAFENSVRELISRTLLDEVGEDWWTHCVSKNVRDAAESWRDSEEKVRWHTQRGQDPIHYTMLPHLLNIIRNNHQPHFAPLIHDIEWAASVFEIIDRCRNVIMHSGALNQRDVARLGTFIRDWNSQVAV